MAGLPRHNTSQLKKSLFDIASSAVRELGVPESEFDTSPFDMGRCMFSYPFVSDDRDLRFNNFYGEACAAVLSKDMKMVAVNRVRSDASPRECYMDDIRRLVAHMVDCIPDADMSHARLSISLGRTYFALNDRLSRSDHANFLRQGAVFKGQYYLRLKDNAYITVTRVACEWKDPLAVVRLLQDAGVQQVSHEKIDPSLDLFLSGRILERRIGPKRQYLGCRLSLDTQTLAAKVWRIQNWYPMTCYFMHAYPSANDVIVRAHVERSVSLHDVSRRMSGLPAMLDGPGLGGWLRRTDVGYKGGDSDSGIKCLGEYLNGEQFTFRLKNVAFALTLRSTSYHFYDSSESKFFLTDDLARESELHFGCAQNRSDLIDAVTHVVHVLLLNSDNDEAMPLTTSPSFVFDYGGARIASIDIQAVLRLKYEDGPLHQLLGLEKGVSEAQCREKASKLISFMEESRSSKWVTRAQIKIDDLIKKLSRAMSRRGIDERKWQ